MFDKENIQHNLKTGADSDVMFTREVTDNKSPDYSKLKSSEGIYKYPFLARSTGNSIKGMTETIESNELRKGRTKSAPRKGNSSAEGSLDIELSPTTFDDNLEAAFRNRWKPWVSDTDSAINLDGDSFDPGYFMTRCTIEGENEYNPEENFGKRRLLNVGGLNPDGLISVPNGCVVHELTCGTEDIKYSVLKKFGGVTNEDLYQEFKHMAVNTLSLDVQIGAIVTGSFGFMGNNNPELLNEEKTRADFGGTSTVRFEDGKTTGNDYIDNLPVKSTDTDQFTSREGNLWINGKNITFAESLSLEINNGLEKKFAIFVKNAISTQPLSLDITGDLSTYLVEGESDELYNLGIHDSTNELMFCFQDKEYDPTFVYVFQIFKTKFGDQDLSSSSADTFSQSLPWNSFEERAVRVFRIALPKPVHVDFVPSSNWNLQGKFVITTNVELTKVEDVAKMNVFCTYKDEMGKELGVKDLTTEGEVKVVNGMISVIEPAEMSAFAKATSREVVVNINDSELKHTFAKGEAIPPAAVTELTLYPESKKLTAIWKDPTDPDFLEVEIDVVKGDDIVYSTKVAKGIQIVEIPGLYNGATYNVSVIAVDKNNNKSAPLAKDAKIGNTEISKALAGKKYKDSDDSHYTFDNVNGVAKHCEMKYSAGTVDFDFKAADTSKECILYNKDYADGQRLVYTYSGDPESAVTLTIKDRAQIGPMVPETINLTIEK